MINFRSMLLTGSLVLAASGLASANTIIQTFALPSGSTTTGWTGNMTVNTFNTNLGALQDIKIIAALTDTETAGGADSNGGSTGTDTYTVTATTTLNLTDPSSELLLAPSNSVTQTFGGKSFGDTFSVSGSKSSNQSATWEIAASNWGLCTSPAAGCLGSGNGQTDPLAYLQYESNGAGTINLTAAATSSGNFGGANFTGAFAGGSANVNVTVVYDYIIPSSTPEPTTMVLFGSGLLAVGLMRRKLKK